MKDRHYFNNYNESMELFFAPFLSALLVCGLLIRFQDWHLRLSADNDFAGPQKFHTRSTPRIGGLGIFIGLQMALGYLLFRNDDLAILYFYLMLASLRYLLQVSPKISPKWWGLSGAYSPDFFQVLPFLLFLKLMRSDWTLFI
jgi:UDP-N-acetylmuramyl pentapeptide phosphotransferase/UDP-N-acetylglucosamine-1-phosphate transferase